VAGIEAGASTVGLRRRRRKGSKGFQILIVFFPKNATGFMHGEQGTSRIREEVGPV